MISKNWLPLLMLLCSIPLFAQTNNGNPYIPSEKNLDSQWVKSLYNKGEQKVYKGEELNHIGMPCAGIGSGQVYITGEGKLCFFESVYNQMQEPNAGHGLSTGWQYMHPQKPVSKVENSFNITIKEKGKQAKTYSLNGADFDDIRFIGEYPLAQLDFRKKNTALPVEVSAEVFSPFVPLSIRSSANPVIVLKYTLTNTSASRLEVSISGSLQNIAFPEDSKVEYLNTAIKSKGLAGVSLEMDPLNADPDLALHPQLGGFTLSVLDEKALVELNAEGDNLITFRSEAPVKSNVSSSINLKPNETKELTFLVSWYFPNYYENGKRYKQASAEAPGWVGHVYNNWYSSSLDVARYMASNFDELYSQTKLFRDTYNNNTLPYWLANRISMPVSTLAAGNVAIWENGRYYGYEGIGFCMGTCGHVYNFVSAVSRLFPELERSVRLMQDFNDSVSFSKSGRINFRGYGPDDPHAIHSYASDAQSGYVLKAYREHLMSPNNDFLESIWEKVKLAIGFHIYKDGAEIGLEPNGVLEGEQTFWDPMWYGPNPYNNTLYLAALRASEEMALVMNEPVLARRYGGLFVSGQKYMNEKMWNDEFYVHLLPSGFNGNVGVKNGYQEPEEIEANAAGFIKAFNENMPNYIMGLACDANQLFGQNWAHQLGLGYILPPENCKRTAGNVFKTCWTPDIGTVYNYKKPEHRQLAAAGEAAMINGSIPEGGPQEFANNHDKSNVWTGLEYEAACDMIAEGLMDEALVSLRSIHDRYDGAKRNPWNEIEGSDHYSRAMHSWNVLLALSGYTCDGPAGILGFAPQLNPENFISFFSSAEGWGNISQKASGNMQEQEIIVKWGQVKLKELKFELIKDSKTADITVFVNGKSLAVSSEIMEGAVFLILKSEQKLLPGDNLKVLID